MRPTTARSSRSSLHYPRSSQILTSSTTSSVYQQLQQQQPQRQILYAPISKPMMTLQPCGTSLHPSCVYPTVQPHVDSSNPAPIHVQGKNNRWHTKNKTSRGQQYYQQQQQQQFSYPKPMMLLDQPTSNVPSIVPPSTTSFLVASSTFTHGPLPSEHYNNTSGVTHLLPQPYFKSPDMQQTFCLIQDRQNVQRQQQHPIQASYYNISAANACSLQTVNASSSFPLANINPYSSMATYTNNQFSASVQSPPFFSTSPVTGLVFAPTRDKTLPLSTLEFSSFKHSASKTPSICESRVIPIGPNDNTSGWPPESETSSKNSYDLPIISNNKSLEAADCSLQKTISTVAKTDEEHYSDASSASFDFTIEAEKMVSALCNTTSSNDLSKEESKTTKTDSTPFSGAGDNVSNKTAWFTDFCSEYENGMSIGVQTDDPCADRSQYPELIRKTAYRGCTEAELVLGSSDSLRTDPKRDWLTCLASATKTAITKSSTCIPVFGGDRVFVDDLINALLRISNGWLSLDNYLNKQHFPNLLDRLDPEFIRCFHTWEVSTYELLKKIVQAFGKFGENDEASASDVEHKCKETCGSSSFPGDVSLYINYDLFTLLHPANSFLQQDAIERVSCRETPQNVTTTPLLSSLYSFRYNSGQQEQHSASQKESKLRSKWTIIENPSSVINTTKSVANIPVSYNDNLTSKFRVKDTFSSKKYGFTQKSLNAEFCQLRNKVMESNADVTKDRRQDYVLEAKPLTFTDNTESIRPQSPAISNPISYRGLYAQNCVSFKFPGQSDSSYLTANPDPILTYEGTNYSLPMNSYSIADSTSRMSKNPEQLYRIKSASANAVYVDKSQIDQVELPAVPRNKVTLLSQIEPRTFDKESEEMAANLSAWFASMRNAQLPTAVSSFEEASAQRLFTKQEMPKHSSGGPKQSQIDANRQFQALQNLPNIQSTPWAAGNFISGRSRVQHVTEEYDSSEDVRVYMKPGSYNVPKKRHQRRPNRRPDNNSRNLHTSNHHHNVCANKTKNLPMLTSSTPLSHLNAPALSANISNATLIKTSFPSASQLPAPLFDLENSPGILKRTEPQIAHRDVTWKAACASAEILLEALNVKDCADTSRKIDRERSTEKDDKTEDNGGALPSTSQQGDPKSTKRADVDCATSYEASEDDSGSTCRLSPSTSVVSVPQSCNNENACSIALGTKTNVKTDSWLIRTLNNASIAGKQRRRKDSIDRGSSESSSSSVIADVKPDQLALSSTADTDLKIPATISDSEYPAIFSREHITCSFPINCETSAKESEGHVGRATYSETVRRSIRSDNAYLSRKDSYKTCTSNVPVSCGTMIPIPGRKCQRKDPEQSYQLLHKSQKSIGKKSARNVDSNEVQLEEESCAKVGNVKSCRVTSKSISSSTTKTYVKKKDLEHSESALKCINKSGDRGWSVWYSSRRKQNLSPLALSKLEIIHQAVWQMDEAKVFKYPTSCGDKDGQFVPTGMTDNYCKNVKSPMFFEIVDYKLKNRAYHKVEHALKDFRRIIQTARLYYQHDEERTKKLEVLSKKLEDLLEEHFGNWDLGSIIGSPREDATVRCKTSGQKLITGRYDSVKKNSTSLSIAEEHTLLLH
ncbi:uncharacterized protein LOC105187754 isoform X1 [Harpegnathos saltator]|uniref:uncharacterized protein LOC105187754 isoform X1 n=1 Tax=Harpegnathos saltator TaxID=610380 RepID=UPI00058F8F79|nr:uncharacterized protein LOC105187754 isoform X1 [Harpegnathos saltator]